MLRSLQDSLVSLRRGLQDCEELLAPKEPGSTLVLSSPRSESVKGYVTRIGTRIVKGVCNCKKKKKKKGSGHQTDPEHVDQDIQLRLNSLPSSRGQSSNRLTVSSSPNAPEIVLTQLVSVRNLINQSLDVVDVSAWTGDPLDARFIFSQLHLLHETIVEAQQMLRGESENVRGRWEEASADEKVSPLFTLQSTVDIYS